MKSIICALFFLLPCYEASPVQAGECVILLHGLLRGAGIMEPLAEAVHDAGYHTVNVDYDSRAARIEVLASAAIDAGLADCRGAEARPIHFITHSMGGILLRSYLEIYQIPELGNSVMIAPPNRGSEIIDNFGQIPGLREIIGPAGLQLETGATSLPLQLGPARFPVGIIAGTRSYNPIFSPLLPQADDGRVALDATRLAGMRDYLVLPYAHNQLLGAPETARQAIHFLRRGHFRHPQPTPATD